MALNKRFLCFFVLQIMLAAQVLMAQHFTVHFMEEAHIASHAGHSHNHSDHNKADKVCQICLLTKGFQNVLGSSSQTISIVAFKFDPIASLPKSLEQKALASAYLARAPPPFLS